MTKHVDDLELTGAASAVTHILTTLQHVFGELKVERYVFTNCGARHVQDRITVAITLDQTLFTNNLRCVAHPQLTDAKPEDECCQELHQLYMPLLG
eukprot:9716630-Lingulodinium_polyedra.AAC.1